MKLIAKKPCSFGGQQFYIGDDIPESFIADITIQERLGIITIVSDDEVLAERSNTLFTQEQVVSMIADAVAEAEQEYMDELAESERIISEYKESSHEEGTVMISVKGDNEHDMEIAATPEEIRQALSIMQMNADDGVKVIAGVESDGILIILHAADSRKTIKEAAKKQADNLFSASNEKAKVDGVDT